MKETVASIRACFALAGIGSLIIGVSTITSPTLDVVAIVFLSLSVMLGVGYLYSSVKFPEFLHASTKFVRTLLYVSGGWGVLNSLLAVVLGTYGLELVGPMVAIIVVWFLFLNVTHLEEEHGMELE